MPLCRVALLSLQTSIPHFLQTLTSTYSITPLVAARVIRWIITPSNTTLDELLKPTTPFDILIILPNAAELPADLLRDHVAHSYTFTAGIPSRQTSSFPTTNAGLLHPVSAHDVPPLTGALNNPRAAAADNTQQLEWTPAFHDWCTRTFDPADSRGAVSMLNLLRFKPGDAAFKSYQTYGQAFAESIGKRRGGTAKLVGKIPPASSSSSNSADGRGHGAGNGDAKGWHELALAHYPSIRHFADMAASEDYQKVNHASRLPALEDTCILMTSEIAVEEELKGRRWTWGASKSRL